MITAIKRARKIAIPQKEAKVVWLLLNHPELTDTDIADLVGCSRTSLYRMAKFKEIRKLTKDAGDKGCLRAGSRKEQWKPGTTRRKSSTRTLACTRARTRWARPPDANSLRPVERR